MSEKVAGAGLDPKAQERVMGMLFGITQGRSLVASAELGVADALANGPLEVGALAAAVQVNAGYLFRLMRALESIGVFQQVSPGVFANTPLSDCLRSDAPGSQRAFARLFAPGMGLWDGYGELLDSVRTGRTTLFDKWGYDFWENLRRDGTKAEIFNESMRSMTASMTPAVTGGYDWSRFATVADIAGGIGTQLVDILNRFPECSGVLFDQPEVVAAAIPHERMRVVGGSFFDEVPIVADAYILRNIIHDWNDEHSLKILQNLRKCAKPGTRVLLVEWVIPETSEFHIGKWVDISMMTGVGGQERTRVEYEQLLQNAGFVFEGVVPTASTFSIIAGRVEE